MNFCWFLLLCSSKSNPGSCKSDTRITNIHQASQQRKCSKSKKWGNKWEIATEKGKKPSNQQITSSKFIPCSHWWFNREAEKTRFDEALWLNKTSLRTEETMSAEHFVFLHHQRRGINGSDSSFSCMKMHLPLFAYILRCDENSSVPLPCQPFSGRRRVQAPLCVWLSHSLLKLTKIEKLPTNDSKCQQCEHLLEMRNRLWYSRYLNASDVSLKTCGK